MGKNEQQVACLHCPYLNHLARTNTDANTTIAQCPVCGQPRCNYCADHYGDKVCPIVEKHETNGGLIPVV